jgi:hypothetical protein
MTLLHRAKNCFFCVLWAVGLVLTAFPLVVDSETWGRFVAWSFSWALTPRPTRMWDLPDLLAAPFFCFHVFSYMIGTAICWWCAGWWLLHREKALISAEVLILLLCNAYVVAQTLPLLALPSGARLRSMGGDPFVFFVAGGLTLFGLTGGAAELCRGRPRPSRAIRVVLSLLPVPLMFTSLILINSIKGFTPR